MRLVLNLSEELSILVTQLAGIGEVIFAVVFFIFYQNKNIIILNILGLTGLLLAVMILQPPLLIEAFNPVTTNLPLIALSIILYNSIRND